MIPAAMKMAISLSNCGLGVPCLISACFFIGMISSVRCRLGGNISWW